MKRNRFYTSYTIFILSVSVCAQSTDRAFVQSIERKADSNFVNVPKAKIISDD